MYPHHGGTTQPPHASSAPDCHLPLNDLVRWTAIGHRLSGERLPAARAAQISLRVVLNDAIHEAFDQPPRATLPILVQQLAAIATEDPYRPRSSFRDHLNRTVTDQIQPAKVMVCSSLVRFGLETSGE